MVSMQKMTATWQGFTGAPGTSTFWMQGSSILDPGLIKTFFDAYAPYIPSTVTIQVNGTGELVDPLTGQVTGTWSGTTPAVTTGSAGAGVLQVSSGPQVRVETGAFRRGKHIRGRIFLVPVSSVALATNGLLSSTAQTALQTAATNLRSASGAQWGVFHRPVKDTSVSPPVVKEQGEFIASSSVVVLTKMASLRSRRD